MSPAAKTSGSLVRERARRRARRCRRSSPASAASATSGAAPDARRPRHPPGPPRHRRAARRVTRPSSPVDALDAAPSVRRSTPCSLVQFGEDRARAPAPIALASGIVVAIEDRDLVAVGRAPSRRPPGRSSPSRSARRAGRPARARPRSASRVVDGAQRVHAGERRRPDRQPPRRRTRSRAAAGRSRTQRAVLERRPCAPRGRRARRRTPAPHLDLVLGVPLGGVHVDALAGLRSGQEPLRERGTDVGQVPLAARRVRRRPSKPCRRSSAAAAAPARPPPTITNHQPEARSTVSASHSREAVHSRTPSVDPPRVLRKSSASVNAQILDT